MPPAASAAGSQPWRLLFVPAILVLAAAAALAVDCPLARWCVDDHCPRSLTKLLAAVEPFGNGFGVLLIVLVVYQLDRARRWALPRLLAMALGAGLAADVVKTLIARVRPRHFNFEGSVADTFAEWLPFIAAGRTGQSFPSAHTATAVGLALALAWLYPRGRWLFGALAVLVACERLDAGAHFLSDVLCGAAVGWLVAAACLNNARLSAWFERLEHRLRTRPKSVGGGLIVAIPGDGSAGQSTDDDRRSRAA